jgi:hypothetical protein
MMKHNAAGRGRPNVWHGPAAGAGGRRFAWAALFATGLGVCMVPMACGSSDAYAVAPEHRAQSSLPAGTIDAIRACTSEGAGRLQRNAYELQFEVEMAGDGAVRSVTPTGRRLEDSRLEGCMIDALRALPHAGFVPESALAPSSSRGLPAHAGNAMGSISVLPELIDLAAVVAGASGVTIVVVVAIVIVVAAVAYEKDEEAERERCKKVKTRCIEECTDVHMPSGQPDGMPYHDCLRKCLEAEGCWGVRLY